MPYLGPLYKLFDPVPAGHGAGQSEESFVDVVAFFVTDPEASLRVEPGKGRLDD